MGARAWQLFMPAWLGVGVPGCSLMGLDEVGEANCKSDLDCADAIRAAGHDPATCRYLTCNPETGYCESALVDGKERLDGKDNDCDGDVDEEARPSEPDASPTAAEPVILSYAFGEAATFAIAPDPDDEELRGHAWRFPALETSAASPPHQTTRWS